MTRTTLFLGIGAATAALLSSAILGTSSASAASANISEWPSLSTCDPSGDFAFCLYYSPGRTGGRDARFYGGGNPRSEAVPVITGKFVGGIGNGKAARDNAASADNGVECNTGIWSSPDYQGNSDWLSPGMGGNLGPDLRNNEASIAVDDSTRCPAAGIG
jgi:hypothetical protein